jgi:cell wall-associated NlpC family hydrolase
VSLTERNRSRRTRLIVTLVVVLAGTLLTQAQAQAVPKPTVDQVRKQVDQLHEDAEAATEKYNAAKEGMASLNVRLAAAQTKLGQQRKAVELARLALGRIAVDTYKAGDLATLSLFLGDDPDKYVQANGLLISLGDQKAQAVTDLYQQRQAELGVLTDIQAQQQRLAQSQKELQDDRALVLQKLSTATALLGQLSGTERGQLTRTLSTSYKTSLTSLGINVPSSGRPSCTDVPIPPLDGRVAKVIGYACAQLGDPYHWAGDGPTNFDCSGLTLMAWKQAGVSLPHNAAMQATYGTKVSVDSLKPGDLVFFHHPIGHVAIYLGAGVMIHAPQTGDVVKIAPMRYNGELVTAVRL